MSELINRSALIDALSALDPFVQDYIRSCVKHIVVTAPAVDAVPVVHARWVYGEDVDIQCSECGRDAMSDWMKYTQVYSPYCPWCGAKMDGGAADV